MTIIIPDIPVGNVNVTQEGGVTTQMATADGVAQANVPEQAVALYSTGGVVDRWRSTGQGDGANVGIGGVSIYMANGSNHDRMRGNLDNISLINASSVTGTQTSPDQTNYNGRGVKIWLNITTFGAALTLHIDYKDPVSGQYLADALTSAAISANTFTQYTIYPGITAAANVSISDVLPRTWRVRVTGPSSSTFTVGASVIL